MQLVKWSWKKNSPESSIFSYFWNIKDAKATVKYLPITGADLAPSVNSINYVTNPIWLAAQQFSISAFTWTWVSWEWLDFWKSWETCFFPKEDDKHVNPVFV